MYQVTVTWQLFIKEKYETHTLYDENLVVGAELRIVFDFIEPIDTKKVNLI